jgi:hypothetical protein
MAGTVLSFSTIYLIGLRMLGFLVATIAYGGVWLALALLFSVLFGLLSLLRLPIQLLPDTRRPELFVGEMRDENMGPHPKPQFEVHFFKDALPRVLPLIEASGLTALVHPHSLLDDRVTSLYTWLLDYALDRGAWVTSIAEVNSWWRRRANALAEAPETPSEGIGGEALAS